MDEDAAKERAKEVYSEKTKQHLIEHPLTSAYFSTETFRVAINSLLDQLNNATDLSDAPREERKRTIEWAVQARAHAQTHVGRLQQDRFDSVPDECNTAFDALLARSDDVIEQLEEQDADKQMDWLYGVQQRLRSDAELWGEGETLVEHLGLSSSE